jgi:hypothetical protein
MNQRKWLDKAAVPILSFSRGGHTPAALPRNVPNPLETPMPAPVVKLQYSARIQLAVQGNESGHFAAYMSASAL